MERQSDHLLHHGPGRTTSDACLYPTSSIRRTRLVRAAHEPGLAGVDLNPKSHAKQTSSVVTDAHTLADRAARLLSISGRTQRVGGIASPSRGRGIVRE